MRNSYSCTHPSLEIDFTQIIRKIDSEVFMPAATLIYVLAGLLAFTTLLYIFLHFNTIIRWFKEHPADGNAIARKIAVGLPPDTDEAGAVELGHRGQDQSKL